MKKIIGYLTIAVIVSTIFTACKKMDSEYRKFVVPGGIIYPGKATAAIAYPGHNRVRISWLRGSDPSVVKAKIFWNNYADSTEINIPSSDDTINVTIDNLPEKSYSFIIITYDAKGNISVPVELLSAAYGDGYQSSLLDRPVVSSIVDTQNNLIINWGPADIANGAYATELKYVDINNKNHLQVIGITDSVTEIPDFKPGSKYQYRTIFLPDSMAIDTFYTDYQSPQITADVSSSYLKNFVQPFQYDLYDGSRWGTLKDWISSPSVKNEPDAHGDFVYGGLDNLNNSGSISLEYWAAPETVIINGKIYQTVLFPEGTYNFKFTSVGDPVGVNRGNDPRYLVAAVGDSLPDIADISSSLSYVSFASTGDLFTVETSFSLSQPTKVSLGLLVNFTSLKQAFRAHEFSLFRVY